MTLHTLTPIRGSNKSSKRIGRGQGSGKGGTATRGHKGAQSRAGYSTKFGFEGGQTPLQRRVPKGGFTPYNKTVYKAINLDVLERIARKLGTTHIDGKVLQECGFIGRNEKYKILAGVASAAALQIPALKVSAHACSARAREAIEAQKGTVVIERVAAAKE